MARALRGGSRKFAQPYRKKQYVPKLEKVDVPASEDHGNLS